VNSERERFNAILYTFARSFKHNKKFRRLYSNDAVDPNYSENGGA
jgi:hypothetical protein